MDSGDWLRVGPWVPEPRRPAGRTAIDELPARPRHRHRDALAADPPSGFDDDEPTVPIAELLVSPDTLDSTRGYRGSRRAGGRRSVVLAMLVVLLATAAVLTVVSKLPRGHDAMQRTGATASVAPADPTAGLPVAYEAESPANTLAGAAEIIPYPGASGGKIVRTLGDWGSKKGDGALRFNNVFVPEAGVYVLTFYYTHPNAEPTRSVLITASGHGSNAVTVTGTAVCCTPQAVRITLNKGANGITFSNPNGSAPALDRIVISQP